MACWYAAPEYCDGAPLMASQQSSFKGTRTAFAVHDAMAATDASSDGPSKKPKPWMHAYSVPERLTPSSRTGWSFASRILLPLTCSPVLGAPPSSWPASLLASGGDPSCV